MLCTAVVSLARVRVGLGGTYLIANNKQKKNSVLLTCLPLADAVDAVEWRVLSAAVLLWWCIGSSGAQACCV